MKLQTYTLRTTQLHSVIIPGMIKDKVKINCVVFWKAFVSF